MTRSQADNWSISTSLAFLAAVFALMLGTLLPFAALAAVKPGQPLVICSAEGPQTIQSGGMDGPVNKHVGAKCAACVMPLAAALPAAQALARRVSLAEALAAVPEPGRGAAVGCPDYLPGNVATCQAAVDPRGGGLALMGRGN